MFIDGRVMVIHTRGPWNTEGVRSYARDQAANVVKLAGQPWVVLAFVYQEGLHTPDAFEAIVETVRAHRRQGRCGTAVVLEEGAPYPNLIRSRFAELYTRAGECFEFFDDESSARDWLENRLSSARSSDRA
jgi:hypothetical protein